MLSDISYSSTFGFAQFDVSNTGTFAFRRSAGLRLRNDRTVRLNAGTGEYSPTWSPDGRVLVLGSRNGLRWIDVARSSEAAPLTTSSSVQVPY